MCWPQLLVMRHLLLFVWGGCGRGDGVGRGDGGAWPAPWFYQSLGGCAFLSLTVDFLVEMLPWTYNQDFLI